MYVCLCRGISDKEIKQLVNAGVSSVEEIMQCTGAGTCCGTCVPEIAALVEETADRPSLVRRRLVILPSEQTAA
ncbi:MAG: (2Fe-2S)-binding protein [Polyangiaceae bacterium]|nr:(2Fe-2S)-binding protein [Polyangiaceae bacterium]